MMSYSQRLKKYEEEKRQLWKSNMSAKDYEKAIVKLAKKWNV